MSDEVEELKAQLTQAQARIKKLETQRMEHDPEWCEMKLARVEAEAYAEIAELQREARLALYAEIMSLRCEPLGRLGMVQALKENEAAASTSSVSVPSSGPGRSEK